jgi:hypothetical protein
MTESGGAASGGDAAARASSRLLPDAPVQVDRERALFTGGKPRRRSCPSLVRLPSGRLLLAYAQTRGPELANDAAVMLAASDDDGETWSEPDPIYATPGWFSMPMGGFAPIADDRLLFLIGRIQVDPSLPGTEPITGWYQGSIASADGGATWSEPSADIRLFPHWTELYGQSNPHHLSDGRLLWACMGTLGRDVGWHSGVSVSDPSGTAFEPPVIIAQAPDRDYSDIDLVRLPDGRFLAVVREHLTLQSVQAWSSDEGRTWSTPRPTPFLGSNLKLFRLPSGVVLCAYRDEDKARRGVSLSWTADGGETWRFGGQLYAAGDAAQHAPGSVCGYPDIVALGGDRLLAVLHTYGSAQGIELRCLDLRIGAGA